MLFDLQGKRRRVVQATYLTLAVLMGGGLVVFGVGGDAPGGLIDAITGGGNGAGNEIIEERVEDNEEQVDSDPRATTPREELVRDYYSLAASQATTNSASFPPDAQDELRRAATHWDAYLELADRPDPSLARVAIQIYGQAGLNQPDSALQAARIVANDNKRDVSAYLLLLQYATLAGDERTEQLATQKALALARTERERKAVQRQIDQITASVALAGGEQGGQGAGGGQGGQRDTAAGGGSGGGN